MPWRWGIGAFTHEVESLRPVAEESISIPFVYIRMETPWGYNNALGVNGFHTSDRAFEIWHVEICRKMCAVLKVWFGRAWILWTMPSSSRKPTTILVTPTGNDWAHHFTNLSRSKRITWSSHKVIIKAKHCIQFETSNTYACTKAADIQPPQNASFLRKPRNCFLHMPRADWEARSDLKGGDGDSNDILPVFCRPLGVQAGVMLARY